MFRVNLPIMLAVALALILAGAGYAYYRRNDPVDNPGTTPTPFPTTTPLPSGVPTPTPADSGPKTPGNPPASQPSGTTKKKVTPHINIAEQVGDIIEVRALVPGILEETGTCKASLTLGRQTVTWEVESLSDAQSTRCDVMRIPRSKFAGPGNWSLIVEYSSATSAGRSETKIVVVK